MEIIPSELHYQIAKYLPLVIDLENFCTSSKLFLWLLEDENFIEDWLKLNLPQHLDDYEEMSNEGGSNDEVNLSSTKIIKKLINREELVFSYGVERLCRLAGRDSSINSYRYYIRTVGWTFNAFENFIDGLIDQNFNLSNSVKAQQILDYILYGDNIDEFLGYSYSSVEVKKRIKIKMKLHKYVVKHNHLETGNPFPIFEEKDMFYQDFDFIEYLATFDILLDPNQLGYIFRQSFMTRFEEIKFIHRIF